MELFLRNKKQVEIASMLWEAQDLQTVHHILNTYGHDAYVAYHMIIATVCDEVTDIHLAEPIIKNIFRGSNYGP